MKRVAGMICTLVRDMRPSEGCMYVVGVYLTLA